MSDRPDTSTESLTAIERLELWADHDLSAPDLADLWQEVSALRAERNALKSEVARLRDMLEDALKFWAAVDPEAAESVEVAAMRKELAAQEGKP